VAAAGSQLTFSY